MTLGPNTRPKSAFSTLMPVARLVRPIVKGLLPKNAVLLQQLFDAWPDLVKGTEAEGSFPEKLTFARGTQNKGKLQVSTLTSAQAMEIQFSQRALLQRINAFFGSETVSEIRVTAYPREIRVHESRSITPSRVTKTSCQSLDKDVARISNPALRARLAEFGSLLHTTDNTGE